ncbi:hypothetical protein PMZ80_005157 [Knufia obscura]|uniref:RNase H type-1 domain-containing protein n=1 Tax=Knufia obscura TaxID=1635080 RepID=A0ABR0RQD2_9EURO|nr:hypothetical protein PMZ80_005157 [Knufia obscura]
MAQPLPNMTSNNQQFQPQYRPREGPVRRTFIPQRSRRYGNPTFPIKKLVKYSPKYGYSRLFNFPFSGSNWRPRMNTIVIQIQGLANPNSSTDPNSAAAAGVYFALLEATLIALKETIAMRQTILDPRWKEIIIMTNSDYVKQSLTRWIWTWERNGWNHMKQQNNPIAHIRTMEELQNIMTYIETTCNMTVRFWKVSREDIAGADGQAQVAMQLKRNNDVANAFAMMGI